MSITIDQDSLVNDLEIEMGELLQKHESQGLDNLLDALDYYVVLLETRRDDQCLEVSTSLGKKN